MLKDKNVFSSFTTNNLEKSREFYEGILGLKVDINEMGILEITAGKTQFVIYPKDNHEPAKFTVLNFEVKDIKKSVDELASKGITFEQYDDPIKTNKQGIFWSNPGPNIAWFKDSAGNILSLIEE